MSAVTEYQGAAVGSRSRRGKRNSDGTTGTSRYCCRTVVSLGEVSGYLDIYDCHWRIALIAQRHRLDAAGCSHILAGENQAGRSQSNNGAGGMANKIDDVW